VDELQAAAAGAALFADELENARLTGWHAARTAADDADTVRDVFGNPFRPWPAADPYRYARRRSQRH
jgi:hypothetical protein